MKGRLLRFFLAALITCLSVNQVNASAPLPEEWKFLDHYATETIAAASGSDEQAILDIERQAQSDPSREARAYGFLAKALLERMHFRLDGADRFAAQCMSAAKDAANDAALALCGWLRMNLAASDGDYERITMISRQIEAANHRLMRREGITKADVESDLRLFFLRGPGSYADVRSRGNFSIHTSPTGPDNIPITYDAFAEPMIKVKINGVTEEFTLDTGAGPTIISKSLAAKLKLNVSRYQEAGYDAQGHILVLSVAFIKSFSVGGFTLQNFPVFVGDLGAVPSILGTDFLRHVGRFAVSYDKLTLRPDVDSTCHAPAILSSAIYPNRPVIGIKVRSNYGQMYAGLDTGANNIGYAMADWGRRKDFGVKPGKNATFNIINFTTPSGSSLAFYVPRPIGLTVGDAEFQRTLRLYAHSGFDNFPLMLSNDSTRDFTYYFDTVNGVACMQLAKKSESGVQERP